jgi:hypothetical protein
MRGINELELILIDLEYEVADYAYRKTLVSDPSELAATEALLTKVRVSTLAIRIALHGMRSTPGRVVASQG